MAPRAVASEHFSADTAEFIRLLHKHAVKYLIVLTPEKRLEPINSVGGWIGYRH